MIVPLFIVDKLHYSTLNWISFKTRIFTFISMQYQITCIKGIDTTYAHHLYISVVNSTSIMLQNKISIAITVETFFDKPPLPPSPPHLVCYSQGEHKPVFIKNNDMEELNCVVYLLNNLFFQMVAQR